MMTGFGAQFSAKVGVAITGDEMSTKALPGVRGGEFLAPGVEVVDLCQVWLGDYSSRASRRENGRAPVSDVLGDPGIDAWHEFGSKPVKREPPGGFPPPMMCSRTIRKGQDKYEELNLVLQRFGTEREWRP
jgi:hypothetical protein